MPSKSICELKIELKAKNIKGITGLNKAGLEALLKGGQKKEPEKPKPFVPAPTKGDTPKVAEKKITKKEKTFKPLMITYKPIKEKKESKPIKLTKAMQFYEKHKTRIEGFMKSPKNVLLSKLIKVESLMTGASTDAEKTQARMQYDILNMAIKKKK